MTTNSMVDGFDHSFELSPGVIDQVLTLITGDRQRGWLREADESGVGESLALNRFAIACSALCELSPRLKRQGDARRAVARNHLVQLGRSLRDLRDNIGRVQSAIGDETYDQMPPGALAALEATTGPRPSHWERNLTFADLVSDPLHWENRAAQLAMTGDWIDAMLPVVDEAAGQFTGPGRTRGSAARVAGTEIVDLIRLLDRSDAGEVRRPSRRHVMAWLGILFDVTGVEPPKSMEVLAKNVLGDRFSKNVAEWRHPSLPSAGRDLLVCTIGPEGQRQWRGALAEKYGQEDSEL